MPRSAPARAAASRRASHAQALTGGAGLRARNGQRASNPVSTTITRVPCSAGSSSIRTTVSRSASGTRVPAEDDALGRGHLLDRRRGARARRRTGRAGRRPRPGRSRPRRPASARAASASVTARQASSRSRSSTVSRVTESDTGTSWICNLRLRYVSSQLIGCTIPRRHDVTAHPDGRRADGARRALVRHLLPAPERPDRLPGDAGHRPRSRT